jgi:hypothetical protein
MVGRRPAGRPWTPAEEAQLRELIASVYARINSFNKLPRDLLFSARPRSLPSERLAAYAKAEISELKRR